MPKNIVSAFGYHKIVNEDLKSMFFSSFTHMFIVYNNSKYFKIKPDMITRKKHKLYHRLSSVCHQSFPELPPNPTHSSENASF